MSDKPELKEICTRPSLGHWMCYGMFFLALASVFPTGFMCWFNRLSSTGPAPLWSIAAFSVFGVIFSFWCTRGMRNRDYWRLTETELIHGRNGRIRFPLSSVEKVVVGLPKNIRPFGAGDWSGPYHWLKKAGSSLPAETPVPSMDKLGLIAENRIPLIVMFRDGGLLRLFLHLEPNGTALMLELVTRLKDRVDLSYSFSAEEMKQLGRVDIISGLARKKR